MFRLNINTWRDVACVSVFHRADQSSVSKTFYVLPSDRHSNWGTPFMSAASHVFMSVSAPEKCLEIKTNLIQGLWSYTCVHSTPKSCVLLLYVRYWMVSASKKNVYVMHMNSYIKVVSLIECWPHTYIILMCFTFIRTTTFRLVMLVICIWLSSSL